MNPESQTIQMCVYEMRHKPKQELMPDNPRHNQETKLVFKVSFKPVLYNAFCLNVDYTYATKLIQAKLKFGIYLR